VISPKSALIVFYIACVMTITTLLPDHTTTYAQEIEPFIVTGLSLSYDGTRVAVIGRSMTDPTTSQSTYYIDILDTSDFQPVSTIEVEETPTTLVALNAAGTRLAYSTVSGAGNIIDLNSGEYLQRGGISVAEFTGLIWNPTSDQLASVQPGLIRISDDDTEASSHTLHDAGGSGRFISVAWSSDGNWLATATYSPSTQETALQIWDLSVEPTFIDTPTLRLPDAGGVALAWNSESTELASLERDGVHLYRAESGEEILHIPIEVESVGLSLALNPDGTRVAVGSFQSIQVWSLPSGDLVQTMDTHGSSQHIFWLHDHIIHSGSEGVYVDGELVSSRAWRRCCSPRVKTKTSQFQ
jgi:WD40 repeat protein